MDPILEVMKDPTFPAIIIDINVGANSRMMDCLVANPINDFGMSGFSKFRAVCIEITPPTKKEIKQTIPKDLIIKSSISFKINSFITDFLVGLLNTFFNIKK